MGGSITIALTRPRGVDSSLATQLTAAGHTVLDCAMTSISNAAQEELAHARALFEAADVVVLVSPQAVKSALANLADTLQGKLIAVMGPGSRALRADRGVSGQSIIESGSQDGLGLVDDLLQRLPPSACVAIGRAANGRDDLARALSSHGLMVNFATLYHRTDLQWRPATSAQLLRAAEGDLRILFTTSSAPQEFVSRIRETDVARSSLLTQRALACCTHPNVAAAAANAGFVRVITQMGDESSWLASLQSAHV
ncbi:MAG: uroporphyrinogen-III synthase [Burkholderiaceae bacterium]